jgi:hypothetical protein
MKTLHELCESQFYKGIGWKISEEQKDRIGGGYMRLVEECKRGRDFGEERKLSSWTFKRTNKCVVDWDYVMVLS